MSSIRDWGAAVRQIEGEKRRLETLSYLAEKPSYEAARSILTQIVNRAGIPTTEDQMATCARWLEEQELITIRPIGSDVVLRLTRAGLEVGTGRSVTPGVHRRDP